MNPPSKLRGVAVGCVGLPVATTIVAKLVSHDPWVVAFTVVAALAISLSIVAFVLTRFLAARYTFSSKGNDIDLRPADARKPRKKKPKPPT